ncbi:MAG: DUF4252 domain-containing protein [Draconibacterium sp.]|nr:DUF4252 domain-containing protein [Draconibacterium sp.]
MKTIKIIVASIFLIASIFANAQSKSDKMYDVLSGNDGDSSFSFSKSMIDAIDLDLGDDDEKNVTGDLHKIRFMSYNPEKGNLSGSNFINKATNLLPSQYNKFKDEEMDDDDDVEIWLLGKKKKFTECHVFIKNEDDNQMRFIVSFYGDFNVNDLENLREKGKGFSND